MTVIWVEPADDTELPQYESEEQCEVSMEDDGVCAGCLRFECRCDAIYNNGEPGR